MIKQTSKLELNFSPKHKNYIKKCSECVYNVAEGAVRAGKTVDNVLAFAFALEECTDKIHLATGSTAANAKLNIGECNGLGLEYLFRGRCHWGKFKGNECLYIKTKTGNKVVIFAGGAKADSFKKIRGNSYGMWIATEINLHHDSTIKEAFNRQLAATQRKIFWDLNPDNPGSLIYQEYLNKYQRKEEKREMVGGYNYEHFTIFDNINIPQENREQFIAQYDPNSVWYKRDILGLRIPAEGLIYRIFSDNPERFIIEDADSYLAQSGQRAAMLMIGVDFGGNGSATTFKAVIITSRFKEVIVADEMYIKREINPEELNEQFSIFAQAITNRYGGAQVRADSAEQILIRGLKYKALKEKIRVDVKNSIKLEINNRIKLENMLMAQDRLKVAKKCTHMIEAFRFAVFDSKKIGKDERLDDGSSDIDSLDAFEYAIEPFYSELMKAGYTQKR